MEYNIYSHEKSITVVNTPVSRLSRHSQLIQCLLNHCQHSESDPYLDLEGTILEPQAPLLDMVGVRGLHLEPMHKSFLASLPWLCLRRIGFCATLGAVCSNYFTANITRDIS